MRCARAIVELLVSTSAHTPYTKHTHTIHHIYHPKHIHHTPNTQSHGGSVLPPTLQSLSQVQPSSASVCVPGGRPVYDFTSTAIYIVSLSLLMIPYLQSGASKILLLLPFVLRPLTISILVPFDNLESHAIKSVEVGVDC